MTRSRHEGTKASSAGISADPAMVWQALSERLRASLPEPTYRLWLQPIRASAAQGSTLYLTAPEGIRRWVERRYASLLNDSLRQIASGLSEISFELPKPQPGRGACADEAALNPTYTFERFVIGETNRLAHAAALAVAEAPAEAYNPLFLHGPPGLGKTHLLAAIANYLAQSAPELSVRYTTAECFTNEFVGALRSCGAEAFKQRYRDLDVLLIDDVQFLEGKQHTEEEFFHTFNALYESGSQIVLSADRIPSEMSNLAARLRDRFEWGLSVPLESPNLATRLMVLRRFIHESGLDLAERDALLEIARRIDVNIRQLRGALTRAIALASIRARPLSKELICEALHTSAPAPTQPSVARIQREVGERFDLSPDDLCGASRDAKVVRARQLAIHLTRQETDLSLMEIGRRFGGRDHTTVLNSLRRVEQALSAEPELARLHEELSRTIHSASTVAP